MARRNITKESQKAIDEGIADLLSGRYENAEQLFKNVVDDLKPRTETSVHKDRFKPYLWTASFGYGLAEGMVEKSKSEETRNISDIAKKANNFYHAYISLGEYGDRDVAYRNLGKNYVSIGFEKEGIEMLEQLKRPRMLDFAKISVKARELLLENCE